MRVGGKEGAENFLDYNKNVKKFYSQLFVLALVSFSIINCLIRLHWFIGTGREEQQKNSFLFSTDHLPGFIYRFFCRWEKTFYKYVALMDCRVKRAHKYFHCEFGIHANPRNFTIFRLIIYCSYIHDKFSFPHDLMLFSAAFDEIILLNKLNYEFGWRCSWSLFLEHFLMRFGQFLFLIYGVWENLKQKVIQPSLQSINMKLIECE